MKVFDVEEIAALMRKGNFAQAEIHLRLILEKEPANAVALNFLGLIANSVNLPHFAINYFSEASRLTPGWDVPRVNLERTSEQLRGNEKIKDSWAGLTPGESPKKHSGKAERFLLIKAWGSGFWADVSHVLGQVLVAEITGRIPIVHWGSNSLFGDGTGSNAFDFYFEPLSEASVDDLLQEDFDFWPPKWNYRNLKEGAINQWAGPFSRVAGLYLLSRPEKVIVGDFYTGAINLRPWIPTNHRLYGLSINELYRYLAQRYLRPKKEILDKIDNFYQTHLASHAFISVHVRGSDKVNEMGAILDDVNKQYKEIIDQYLSGYNCDRIFLMTDDSRVLDYFLEIYGNKVITTDCQRTSDEKGIHYQAGADRRRLGEEVIVDAYLAARGKAFIGNGFSNPSLVVSYLKDWPEKDVYLHSLNINLTYNTFLHKW
jgi:hypothetical protein